MTEDFRQGHYILGIEGPALLRAGARRNYGSVTARVEEIREIASPLGERPYSERRDLPEAGVDAGLTVRRCIEPALSAEDARARAKGQRTDAFEDAVTGVPAVIVWEAERVPA